MHCHRPTHLSISLIEEVLEQEEEHARVHSNPPDEGDWIVARIPDQQLEGVQHDGDELHHLEHGQVLLPPQIFLHLRSHRGQHVIRVHHDVNAGVDEAEERRVTARRELNAPPHTERHDT